MLDAVVAPESHRRLALAALGLTLPMAPGCPGDDSPSPSTPSTTSSGSSEDTNPDIGTTASVDSTGQTTDDGSDETGPAALPARRGVTADWLAQSLTVIDLDAIAAGAQTYEEAAARTIDLSDHLPGPLQVELAPDGVTAVVSISPGFYGGFVGSLIGVGRVEQDGTLLLVDLETEAVTEVSTVHVPMGIAIAADGSRAYTANYGLDDPIGTTVSVIDLVGATVIEEVEVGERPEQITLSEDGSLAIFNVVGLGAVRVFQTADPSGTLSPPLELGNDPSDVDFIPGTSYAVVANSLDPSNYVVVDVADPLALVEVEVGPSPLGAYYGVTRIPGTSDVLITASDFASVLLDRITVAGDGTSSLVWQRSFVAPSFPMGVAIDLTGGVALTAAPGSGANVLLVQDLASETSWQIPWREQMGPTYVAVAP